MLPLSGLPRGDTSLLLAVTTVVELAKLAVVGYWLWRWKRDTDAREPRNDKRQRYLDEQELESERRIQALRGATNRLKTELPS